MELTVYGMYVLLIMIYKCMIVEGLGSAGAVFHRIVPAMEPSDFKTLVTELPCMNNKE
jgi:hypothetical protein